MKWRCMPVPAVLLGLLLALPAQAQPKAALQVIPDDAIGYVLLNGLEQVNDKIQAVAKKVQAPLPLSPLGFAKTLVGIDKGIDEKGTVALILFDRDGDDEPIAVLAVPVTNYNDVLNGLGIKEAKDINEVEVAGKNVVIGKKGNYALVTESKSKDVLQKALASTKSISPTATQIDSYLAQNDLVAVITGNGVKMLCGLAEKGLGEAKNQALVQQPFVGDYLDWVGGCIKAAAVEVPNVAFGLKIDDQHNVSMGMRVEFKKGGAWAKACSDIKPLVGGPLNGLPDGPTAFAIGGVYPEQFLVDIMKMNTQMLKSLDQLSKKDLEKLEKAYMLTAKGVQGAGLSLGVIKEGQSLMHAISAVAKVENSSEYLENYIAAMDMTSEIYKKAKDLPFPQMQAKSIKVGDAPGAEVEIDMSKNEQFGENEKKIMEKILGEGGKIRATVVAADKNTVLIGYVGAKEMEKALEAYRKNANGLANNPVIAKTAALLPAGSQWAAYIGPKEIADLTRRMVNEFAGGIVQVPDFPQTPPVGIGAEVSGSGFEMRLVAPAAVLEGMGKFIKEVQRQQGFL